MKAYTCLLHVLLCQSCFIESSVRLHLRSLWILPPLDHPVWHEVRDRSRTPRTPPTRLRSLRLVFLLHRWFQQPRPKLLGQGPRQNCLPFQAPQRVCETLFLVKPFFSLAYHFETSSTFLHCMQTNLIEAVWLSPSTILHCLQTNLVEAVYFYSLLTFANCWLHLISEVVVWHMH